MQNVTFILHYRKDCDDREENINICLTYYKKHFPNSQFIVVEDDKQSTFIKTRRLTNKDLHLFFYNKGLYRRPLCYNIGARAADGDKLVFIDTDVIIKKEQLQTALETIDSKDVGYALPYNGTSLYVNQQVKERFAFDTDFDVFEKITPSSTLTTNQVTPHFTVANTKSIGGCFVFSRKSFNRMGGFNSDFVAWGYEDNELVTRCDKVGLKIVKLLNDKAFLWHIPHRNTVKSGHAMYESNIRLDSIVKTMDINKINKLCASFMSSADIAFREKAKGKRVAIVGPAPHIIGTEQFNKINNYDEVIRINKAVPVPLNIRKDVGSKTTILYNCLNVSEECGGAYKLDDWKANGVEWVICPYAPIPPFDADISKFYKELINKNAQINARHFDSRAYKVIAESLGTRPNSGFLAILDSLMQPYEEIYITGFSFFKGGYYPEYRQKNEKQVMDFMAAGCGHQQAPQLELMKILYKTDRRIKVDSYLEEMLSK